MKLGDVMQSEAYHSDSLTDQPHFKGLLPLLLVIKDVLICNGNFTEHKEHFQKVLQRLSEAGGS